MFEHKKGSVVVTQTQMQDFMMFLDNMVLAEEPLEYESHMAGVRCTGALIFDSYTLDGTYLTLTTALEREVIAADLKDCSILETEDSIVYYWGNLKHDFVKIIFYENF